MGDRANPLGWTERLFLLKAAQLEAMDARQSNLLDGAGGGTYAPTSPIRVEGRGFGSDALKDTTITGTLRRTPDGRWGRVVDTTTITDTGSTQLLDMSSDVYLTTIDHSNNITIHLASATGQTPDEGDIIEVIRIGIPSSPASFQIYDESYPAARIGAFIQTAPAGNQLNQVYSAKYVYGGSFWRPLRFSSDVSY